MDRTEARILRALNDEPRATTSALAERTGLSRNTVQARLARLDGRALGPFERRIEPGELGYPLLAFIALTVTQQLLDDVASALAGIAEVLEVFGMSGPEDILVRVAARDADDLYRIAGFILSVPGVERTQTSLVMRHMIDFRVTPLLSRIEEGDTPPARA